MSTTNAGSPAAGKSRWTSAKARIAGSARLVSERSLGLARCSDSAGAASTSSNATETPAASRGRRRTRSTSAGQKQLSSSATIGGTKGTRPRSILGPRTRSTAGNTVIDPTTAQTMTAMVPAAIPFRTWASARNRPAIAIATVVPTRSRCGPTSVPSARRLPSSHRRAAPRASG